MAVYWSENEGGASSGQVMPKRPLTYSADKATEYRELADAYNLDPVGAGPLDLVEHIPQTSMLFERFRTNSTTSPITASPLTSACNSVKCL